MLRSKTPAMVEREVWAHLLVHYAIRTLMHQAACDQGLDPDRLSSTRSLHIARRHLVSHAAFPPDQAAHATRLAIAEILTERLPPRRLRAFPRAVKRKMSNFKLQRPAHRSWPRPTRPDTQAIVLLPRPG